MLQRSHVDLSMSHSVGIESSTKVLLMSFGSVAWSLFRVQKPPS